MKTLKIALFLIIAAHILSACTEIKSTKYQDTSHLESPPEMEIIETAKAKVEYQEEKEVTGIGKHVVLAGTTKNPVLKIKKLFDRSWSIVEQALKLNEVKVTDKNRDQGVFYVDFDPDSKDDKDSGSISFSLFSDDFEEASYKLTVIWRESDTEVSAELTQTESSDLLDDDEDKVDFDSSIDSGAILIKTLYKTIRDDLPVN